MSTKKEAHPDLETCRRDLAKRLDAALKRLAKEKGTTPKKILKRAHAFLARVGKKSSP